MMHWPLSYRVWCKHTYTQRSMTLPCHAHATNSKPPGNRNHDYKLIKEQYIISVIEIQRFKPLTLRSIRQWAMLHPNLQKCLCLGVFIWFWMNAPTIIIFLHPTFNLPSNKMSPRSETFNIEAFHVEDWMVIIQYSFSVDRGGRAV